ncbi:MAG TPA: hypothetical protein VI260_35800 [Blastocatellia bacterium]|jgi:hypothetical protein
MYTYDVQYVDFRYDQVKEMGEVDTQGAVKAFHAFPFKEQQLKARSLSEATYPTISFRAHPDKWTLSIWSLEPDLYEVYLEGKGKKVTVETRDQSFIVNAIERFFSGGRSELYEQMAGRPGAVTSQRLWDRIVSMFSRNV